VDRDYRKVLTHCDRAVVLQKGQVVLAGPHEQLAADPQLGRFLGL